MLDSPISKSCQLAFQVPPGSEATNPVIVIAALVRAQSRLPGELLSL